MTRLWRWLMVLALVGPVFAQEDPQLRMEAVRLLERAVAVGQPPPSTARRAVVHFSWFGDAAEQRGQVVAVVVPQVGYKRTYDFGDYHAEIAHHADGTVMTVGDLKKVPTAIRLVIQVSTVTGAFDHEDVIRAINSSTVNGRLVKCIVFETIFGEKRQQNEACVDAQNGALLRLQVGNERTELAEYKQIAGSYYAGRIDYYRGGALLLTMTDEESALDDVAHALDVSNNAVENRACREFRRAFAQSVPQPPPGVPGAPADITIHGVIGKDGRVHDAIVDSPDHQELHAKALEIIAQWTYTPPLCNGHPGDEPTTFVLHFR